MNMIYIFHPYTGADKENRQAAAAIEAEISNK